MSEFEALPIVALSEPLLTPQTRTLLSVLFSEASTIEEKAHIACVSLQPKAEAYALDSP